MPSDPGALLKRSAYWKPAFLFVYLKHLDGLIFDDPRAALPWAEVAPPLALLVPEKNRRHSEGLSMAYAILGGALRSIGEHERAESEYKTAMSVADAGVISPDVRAEIEGRLAILRACQGRYNQACELELAAIAQFRRSQQSEALGEALARLGYILCEAGRFDAAVPVLGEALVISEPKLSGTAQRVHHTATHNLASAILHTSRHNVLEGAFAQVRAARRLLRPKSDNVPRHKLGWLEGLIWWRMGSTNRERLPLWK